MRRVLVDVDVQFDFCDPEGALYVPNALAPTWRALVRWAADGRHPIVGSVDSHAFDAWEFASNSNRGPSGEKPNFPDHCVKGTRGWLKPVETLPERFRFVAPGGPTDRTSYLVAELSAAEVQAIYFEKEVYSLFANDLAEPFVALLASDRPTEFIVFGLATEYCVKAAALGLRERGHRTVVLTDAIAGLDPAAIEIALAEIESAGCELQSVRDVLGAAS